MMVQKMGKVPDSGYQWTIGEWFGGWTLLESFPRRVLVQGAGKKSKQQSV